MHQPQQPGQPGHPGVPQQPNPALGGQPPQQQGQAPPQQPPAAVHSGLVDPNQQPVSSQPYLGLQLNPSGPQVPVQAGPDGQLHPMIAHELLRNGGPNIHPHVLMVFVEAGFAFSRCYMQNAWLARRLDDLERKAGVKGISYEEFFNEQQQAIYAQQEQPQPPQQGQAPPQQQGQAPPQHQQGQASPQQPPPGHGMPGTPHQ